MDSQVWFQIRWTKQFAYCDIFCWDIEVFRHEMFRISIVSHVLAGSIRGGTPDDRKAVEEILQETWESADDWFQP
ncbi:DinI-like family protein [Photorhabdus thracensis]|uniref:DinI-like family protein n=1 Tax=Photorhabdus thracensis TaxID=230089 RepID=UPI001E5AEBD3|nr:DinI-like family protein [Photorhabdus thracensis]MCC8421376.1 DinI-like family protein [Photorhabdus thracensis]